MKKTPVYATTLDPTSFSFEKRRKLLQANVGPEQGQHENDAAGRRSQLVGTISVTRGGTTPYTPDMQTVCLFHRWLITAPALATTKRPGSTPSIAHLSRNEHLLQTRQHPDAHARVHVAQESSNQKQELRRNQALVLGRQLHHALACGQQRLQLQPNNAFANQTPWDVPNQYTHVSQHMCIALSDASLPYAHAGWLSRNGVGLELR